MATPDLHIKSAARKLPIKRKSHLPPSSDPDPIPNPNPNPDNGFYDDFPDDDEDADFADGGPASSGGGAAGGDEARPPPFKFHRIWSESDEIRFLQGLLGCFSQGMVFPRDLNLFYDRFSESMPQPFTRSQLSEKLRRLRRKYRSASARIDRGHDPSRLAPHDRDLLHLCTRLWHPSHAASSPFASSPDGAVPPPGNKRRRANPRGQSPLPAPTLTSSPPLALPAPVPGPTPVTPPASTFLIHASDLVSFFGEGNPAADSHVGGNNEEKQSLVLPNPPTLHESKDGYGKGGAKTLLVKTVLDVFDGSLTELKTSLGCEGMLQQEQQVGEAGSWTDFAKRWQQQRLEELDVLALRLRLMVEDTLLS